MKTTPNIPNGVWPVMLTPFNADRSIDWPGYEALIEFYIEQGVVGLFANCGSSEAMHLESAEMLALVEKAVQHAAGRVPVVGGALIAGATDEVSEFVGRVHALGTEAAVLAPSRLVAPDDDERLLQERLQAIVDGTGDVPLGIYEWPQPYHRVLSPSLLGWIAHTGRFVFHKDTCCDIDAIRAKLATTQDTCLQFFNANLPTLLPSLALGVDGYCSTGANFCPEAYVALCDAAATQPSRAEQINNLLIATQQHLLRSYPRSAKIVLAARGVPIQAHCRRPVDDLTTDEQRALLDTWARLEEAYARIQSTTSCRS